VIGGKMAGGDISNFCLTIIPQVLRTYFAKIIKYALVRLNAQKTCFKSKMGKPGFGHF